MEGLKKLSRDVYFGKVEEYTKAQGENAIRAKIEEAVGGEFNYKNFRKHKYDVFAILEEALEVAMGTVISNQFDRFAEVKDTAMGDKPEFEIKDRELYRVSRISAGNNDIRRQRNISRKLTMETDWYGVAIYEELEKFMAGNVDWADMINTVALSFVNHMGTKIYDAIFASYGSLSATYGINGALDEQKLLTLCSHVQAKTGKKPAIFGTASMLNKLTTIGLTRASEGMKDQLNQFGYVGKFMSYDALELPQAHKPGTDAFAIDNNFLLVVPNDEKIVKVLLEGEAIMVETADAGDRNDMQLEYQLQRKFGISILMANFYGIYTVTA